MVSIVIIKDMFEPSYNDLIVTIWNCNYICTNLIVYSRMQQFKMYLDFHRLSSPFPGGSVCKESASNAGD